MRASDARAICLRGRCTRRDNMLRIRRARAFCSCILPPAAMELVPLSESDDDSPPRADSAPARLRYLPEDEAQEAAVTKGQRTVRMKARAAVVVLLSDTRERAALRVARNMALTESVYKKFVFRRSKPTQSIDTLSSSFRKP